MIARAIRGTNQIGGSIIEVSTASTRLILDVGSELGESDPQPPCLKGLFQGNACVDAVLISHYHSDHIGLIDSVLPSVPIYMGTDAYRIYEASCSYSDKEIRSGVKTFLPGEKFVIGGISITPILCDHSAFDSYMFFLEGDGKSVLYTGDFRSNGRKSFASLLRRLPHADLLITEGTTLSGTHSLARTEADLENEAVKAIETRGEKPVFVNMAATNIDRIVTVYKAAQRTGRILLMDAYTAHIARAAGGSIPRPGFRGIRVFLTNPTEKNYQLLESFGKAKIGRVAITKEKYVMTVRPSMKGYLQKLAGLQDFRGGLFFYSLWSGYLEQKSTADFVSFMKEKGVDVEMLHTSGHADALALDKLIEKVDPSIILPVHTENPSWFERYKEKEIVLESEPIAL